MWKCVCVCVCVCVCTKEREFDFIMHSRMPKIKSGCCFLLLFFRFIFGFNLGQTDQYKKKLNSMIENETWFKILKLIIMKWSKKWEKNFKQIMFNLNIFSSFLRIRQCLCLQRGDFWEGLIKRGSIFKCFCGNTTHHQDKWKSQRQGILGKPRLFLQVRRFSKLYKSMPKYADMT